VYVLAALVTGVYYLIIAPMPSIDYEVGARTLVAVFSMFCAFMWLPSFRDKFDFNCVALVHFKSAFTAILIRRGADSRRGLDYCDRGYPAV
jgi:hypothetical protein